MSHSSETGETGKATADRGASSWRRWPTRREWLIIGIAIGWPVGLYLYSQYGDRRVFREFAGSEPAEGSFPLSRARHGAGGYAFHIGNRETRTGRSPRSC